MAQKHADKLRGIQTGLAKISELEERAQDMKTMVQNMEQEFLRSIGATIEDGYIKMKTEDFYRMLNDPDR